jgi:invasion protein IalB
VRQFASSFAFAAILTAATPAFAQTPAQPQPQPNAAATKVPDADPVICEKQEEIGTRLVAHKICHTRSQWAQIHGEDRSMLEHTQQQRTLDGNGH